MSRTRFPGRLQRSAPGTRETGKEFAVQAPAARARSTTFGSALLPSSAESAGVPVTFTEKSTRPTRTTMTSITFAGSVMPVGGDPVRDAVVAQVVRCDRADVDRVGTLAVRAVEALDHLRVAEALELGLRGRGVAVDGQARVDDDGAALQAVVAHRELAVRATLDEEDAGRDRCGGRRQVGQLGLLGRHLLEAGNVADLEERGARELPIGGGARVGGRGGRGGRARAGAAARAEEHQAGDREDEGTSHRPILTRGGRAWESGRARRYDPAMADDTTRRTDSGIEIKPQYTAADLEAAEWDPIAALGDAGSPPYTRGVYGQMYRTRPWTMRQYSGFGTAAETNERFHFLLGAGQTGLSCAFDLPTQMGYDSDHPRAEGEVGKVGVAIDSLEDMEILLSGLPLDTVTTSMTINSTAAILLLFYELVAEKNGVPAAKIGGTIQNDILKEYVARGTYIYPPRPSMRIITDIFAYCGEHVPRWNTISISGYHIREAGSTAVQEIAFTLSNAIAYVQAAVDAGLDVDDFAPRLSFFWNGHNNFFEEVAKFRAARRMWYWIMSNRFGAQNEKSKLLRFHTQTAGSMLTAQQPENNVVRVALQAMAAALGGTQSLHTNGFDEALGLPTERAAKIALRTQQIVAYETGMTETVDPLAGSYFVESLTNEVEAAAWRYIEKIDDLGGAVAAIEAGYLQDEIERAAFEWAKAVDDGEKVIVGLNKFADPEPVEPEVFPIDPALERQQTERLRALRAKRDQAAVDARARRRARRGEGHAEPPVPDEGGAARLRHARRGLRRPARRVRRLPTRPLTPTPTGFVQDFGGNRPGNRGENEGQSTVRRR